MDNFINNENEEKVSSTNELTVDDTEFQNTASIDTNEIAVVADKEIKKSKFFTKDKGGLIGFIASHKIISSCIAAVLVVALVSLAALSVTILSNPLYGYAQAAAAHTNIVRTTEVEGTLTTSDRYEITSLVSGKIISSEFEVGDTVSQNDTLYKLDDTDAKLAVERAMNEADRANGSVGSSSSSVFRIIASEEGTVQSLSIKTGSSVSPGSQVGTIKRADGTTASITSYISGTVTVVSVRAGQTVSAGQVIASVNSSNPSDELDNTYYKKNTEIDLQAAQRNLEKYSINSPVSGVVVEKYAKAGDNVFATDTDNPMMVILDTSSLKFSFTVDINKVADFEKGQTVYVRCDTFPNTEYPGEISSVSSIGVPDENGNPMFEVTVTVTEPDNLRAGMKVSGTVVLARRNNALSVPEKALMESDGKTALVLVKSENTNDDEDLSEVIDNEINFPWIKVPKGCELITVEYGLSDGTNVEILAGLTLADIVVYDPDNEAELVPMTVDTEKDFDALDDGTDILFDFDDEDDYDDYSIDDSEPDEETKEALKDEIEKLLHQA